MRSERPILRGIENALYPLSYLPIFADAHNQRERFERYLEMLLERHVDALIVVANWLFVDIHVLADLNKREIPAATIGWELPGNLISSVMVDNEAGGRLALEHLWQLPDGRHSGAAAVLKTVHRSSLNPRLLREFALR